MTHRDFPGSSVVKNPPCNAGDVGSISGQGAKTPYAMEQLTLCAATIEPACSELVSHNWRAHVLQRKILRDATKILHAKTEDSCKKIKKFKK